MQSPTPSPPGTGRLSASGQQKLFFPSLEYSAKGSAPTHINPARTAFGYERLPGMLPFPSPPRGSVRPRHDACLIRPDRSLNLEEIMSGALSGPDAGRYQRLLQKNQMSSDEAARARRRWRAAAKVASLTAKLPKKTAFPPLGLLPQAAASAPPMRTGVSNPFGFASGSAKNLA